jgi:16S rRNA processing protein RimM
LSDNAVEPGGEDLLVVGRIIRPHGIRGAVIVEAESDWPERFSAGSSLLVEAAPGRCEPVLVESSSTHKGRLLLYLAGVTDRNSAGGLKGKDLLVRACDAAPLEDGEFWAHDLVGMSAVDEDGRELGEVTEVICRAAQDLLVLADGAGAEFRVPFVEEFVMDVDEGRGVITLKVIEGMVP